MFEPRAHLCATIVIMLATLFSESWGDLGVVTGLLVVTLVMAKLSFRRLVRNLLYVSWLAVFTLGAHLIGAHAAGHSLSQGWQAGGLAGWRLMALVGWGTVLGQALSPLRLAAALERLLSPLTRLGVPVQAFGLVVMLSVRFLPILVYDHQMLVRTYIARGIDLPHAPRRARLKLYLLMGVPLFTHLLRRVEHISAAMETRAFQALAVRTVLRQTSLRARDYALIGGSFLGLGLVLML
jgi:energy-coupling factor transport system permease protein